MILDDAAALAERFVAVHFPQAANAVLGGSTARGERTATSDIDLLLIGDDLFDDVRTEMAARYAFEGEIFEVFAYTRGGFVARAEEGVRQYRPVIVHLLVDGVPFRAADDFASLRASWNAVISAGPRLVDQEQRLRRYQITDVLDDLRDAEDPLEREVIASTLFRLVGELMLLDAGQWIGTGKYLARRLREWDTVRTAAIAEPFLRHDHERFADAVAHELDRAGGRVQAGFIR